MEKTKNLTVLDRSEGVLKYYTPIMKFKNNIDRIKAFVELQSYRSLVIENLIDYPFEIALKFSKRGPILFEDCALQNFNARLSPSLIFSYCNVINSKLDIYISHCSEFKDCEITSYNPHSFSRFSNCNFFGNLYGYKLIVQCCNLTYVRLPAPSNILSWKWVTPLTSELTQKLMLWDAYNHTKPEAFDTWASVGHCPYENKYPFTRASFFNEKRSEWHKITPEMRKMVLNPSELAIELLKLQGNTLPTQLKS